MLDWQRLIRGTPRDEVKATQRTGQQINLDTTLEPSRAPTRIIATARPGRAERVGQANGRAIVNTDAGEASKNGDRHRLGGDHMLNARGQDLLEQGGGGRG